MTKTSYYLLILSKDYSKNFTTGHNTMFVVKSIVIQIDGQDDGSIISGLSSSILPNFYGCFRVKVCFISYE